MKVVDIGVTSVTVPLEAPLHWSMGVETGTTRGLITLQTDEGIVGIGEIYGGNAIEHAIATAKPYVLGLDPLDVGALMHRLNAFCIGYETSVPAVVRAGIEMACLDAAGKALNLPVYKLLGGKTRDRIEFGAYLFYRYTDETGTIGGECDAGSLLERARQLVRDHGFRAIKFKGGVCPPEQELQVVKALHAGFPDFLLRWDPNAAWSVETSIRIGHHLMASGVDLERGCMPVGPNGSAVLMASIPSIGAVSGARAGPVPGAKRAGQVARRTAV